MKKWLKVLSTVFTTIIVVFTVCIMLFTVISFNTEGKQEATFLGYKPNVVITDSMRGEFNIGDIVVSKRVDVKELKPGDIITFRSIDPNSYQKIITHKIDSITTYEGQIAFKTYGTTTGVRDIHPVPGDQVLGQYKFRLPKMGYFFNFLKTPTGYFTVILLPFLLLIGIQAFKFFRLVKKYRSEQQDELNAQRSEMEAERAKAQEMMDELARLRAQLTGQADVASTDKVADVALDVNEEQLDQTEGE